METSRAKPVTGIGVSLMVASSFRLREGELQGLALESVKLIRIIE
jgi:hypothetical protein